MLLRLRPTGVGPYRTVVLATAVVLLACFVSPRVADARQSSIERACTGVCELRVMIGGDSSLGSGFLIDAAAGLIVTNWHVVAGGNGGLLSFYGQADAVRFEVMGYSVDNDLAIVRVPKAARAGLAGRWVFALAPDDPPVGSDVFSIGYPGGWGFSVRRGIVTTIGTWGSDLAFPAGRHLAAGSKLVQHDSGLGPGSSGGPLVNDAGVVVGVNTFSVEVDDPSRQSAVGFAMSTRHVKSLVRETAPEAVKHWSEIAKLGHTVSEESRLWVVPEVKVPPATASSAMTSIRALPRVAACTSCRGDGDVGYQQTIPSGSPMVKGRIIRGEKTCGRCGGDGYNRDWSKVQTLLNTLTVKVAGLNKDDPKYRQAVEQFASQLVPVVSHTPRNWARLVNADCFDRLKTPEIGAPIFGVGACSWTFNLRGAGKVAVVIPSVESEMTRRYVFVTIEPHIDNRVVDDVQYAFWGGIIADVQQLQGDTAVVFIRRGFLVTP